MSLTMPSLRNRVIAGDCVVVMQAMPAACVDFILTDPPYVCRYRSRDGKTVRNDDNTAWIRPAYREMYRVLKPDSLCLSFYGWHKADVFIDAWQAAGFRIAGHVVFCKSYASSVRHLARCHEQAYLLAKGDPVLPANPPSDVMEWVYTGNRLHPTQKPAEVLKPFVEAFCPKGGLVLDPFCGSGSTLIAADKTGRNYLGMELDEEFVHVARSRLQISPVTVSESFLRSA